jgi:hypothetical protein
MLFLLFGPTGGWESHYGIWEWNEYFYGPDVGFRNL